MGFYGNKINSLISKIQLLIIKNSVSIKIDKTARTTTFDYFAITFESCF